MLFSVGYIQNQVAHGKTGTGVDVAIDLVSLTAAIRFSRNKDLTGNQAAPAPAAYPATAAVWPGNAGTLKGHQNVLIGRAGNGVFLVAHDDPDLKYFIFCFHGITGIFPGAAHIVIKLFAVEFPGKP